MKLKEVVKQVDKVYNIANVVGNSLKRIWMFSILIFVTNLLIKDRIMVMDVPILVKAFGGLGLTLGFLFFIIEDFKGII